MYRIDALILEKDQKSIINWIFTLIIQQCINRNSSDEGRLLDNSGFIILTYCLAVKLYLSQIKSSMLALLGRRASQIIGTNKVDL